MTVFPETVRRVARSACIAVDDDDVERLKGEFESILRWVAHLDDVDVTGVDPFVGVLPAGAALRRDEPRCGDDRGGDFLAGAPSVVGRFFSVPKVLG